MKTMRPVVPALVADAKRRRLYRIMLIGAGFCGLVLIGSFLEFSRPSVATASVVEDSSSPYSFVVGFSPASNDQSALEVVLQAIGEAKATIHVAAYSFTSKPIATALVDAKGRGVDVRIVVDAGVSDGKYSAATFTANQGVPTKADSHYAIMHNKFMIVDGKSVETGSFNYTAGAADRNAENAILLRNRPEIAAIYEAEWQRLWAESTDISPRY